MSSISELRKALNLENDIPEEDIPFALTAVIISATQDPHPQVTLQNIHHAVCQNGFQSYLEPLDVVPPLLSSLTPGADDLLSLIAECGSPKETLLVCEEAIEKLLGLLEDGTDADVEAAGRKPLGQIGAILELFATALPRLKLRRNSPQSALNPLLNLKSVITSGSHHANTGEARDILHSATKLVASSSSWIESLPSLDPDELNRCKEILKAFLLSVVEDLSAHLDTQISLRIFHQVYPRLRLPGSLVDEWEKGEEVIQEAIAALKQLGYNITPSDTHRVRAILFAHTDMSKSSALNTIQTFRSLLLSSIQSNANLDEVIAILLSTLRRLQNDILHDLDEDLVVPLTAILPALASTHPDPTIRHLTYRCLSLSISLASPQLRLHILKDLTSSENNAFPQLQVAAVGLVKEVLIECLQNPSTSLAKLFLSESIFFPTFGPILFRPNPPDLFSDPHSTSKKQFIESSEPQRLTECLTLYYLLLVRDTHNQSGIRNKDIKSSVASSLIAPLRRQLAQWNANQDSHDHSFSLLPLEMGITRIDEALANIDA